MISNLLIVMGTWIFSDGLYSLFVYIRVDKFDDQSWLFDHSFRILRCLIGIAIITIGWRLV